MRVNVFELTWASGGKMAAKEYVVPASEGDTFDFPAAAEDDVRALNKAKCAWQLVFMCQTMAADGFRKIPKNAAFCSYHSKPSTWMTDKEVLRILKGNK
jgi:hypothetical protein